MKWNDFACALRDPSASAEGVKHANQIEYALQHTEVDSDRLLCTQRFRKVRTTLLGIFILLFAVMPGFAEDRLRVGLFFGSSARASYSISGSDLAAIVNGTRLELGSDSAEVRLSSDFSVGESFATYEEARLYGSVYYDGISYFAAERGGMGGAAIDGILVQTSRGENLLIPRAQELKLEARDNLMTIASSRYRGALVFAASGSEISAINDVDVEDYLKGVVPKEMPASWHEEALKAQAVVARSYQATNRTKHQAQGFHVCATTHCQVYGGYAAEQPSTNRAVEATRGELLYYGGRPAEGYFHSSSGGRTESSGNLWNLQLPYLVGVEELFAEGSIYDQWSARFTFSEIRLLLQSNGIDIGEVTGAQITKTTENGRALELTILGTRGTHVLQKDRIRIFFGGERVRSTYVTIAGQSTAQQSVRRNDGTLSGIFYALADIIDLSQGTTPAAGNEVVFEGRGYGHGVGMSQYGAAAMAKKGYDYREILRHYFTGIDIHE